MTCGHHNMFYTLELENNNYWWFGPCYVTFKRHFQFLVDAKICIAIHVNTVNTHSKPLRLLYLTDSIKIQGKLYRGDYTLYKCQAWHTYSIYVSLIDLYTSIANFILRCFTIDVYVNVRPILLREGTQIERIMLFCPQRNVQGRRNLNPH